MPITLLLKVTSTDHPSGGTSTQGFRQGLVAMLTPVYRRTFLAEPLPMTAILPGLVYCMLPLFLQAFLVSVLSSKRSLASLRIGHQAGVLDNIWSTWYSVASQTDFYVRHFLVSTLASQNSCVISVMVSCVSITSKLVYPCISLPNNQGAPHHIFSRHVASTQLTRS